jgi:hypothetical protein
MQIKKIAIIIAIILLATFVWWYMDSVVPVTDISETVTIDVANDESDILPLDPVIAADIASKADLIVLNSPQPNDYISSPLQLSGQARGYWFFEASFPIVLTNWDGLIIAEGYATATSDWMTEEFVPFTATLEFTSPYVDTDPDFMSRGSLILQKDNPSGLPENDNALELPIYFE